jgi:hypothetical protein
MAGRAGKGRQHHGDSWHLAVVCQFRLRRPRADCFAVGPGLNNTDIRVPMWRCIHGGLR